MADRNEPLDRIKSRRNAAVAAIVDRVPYIAWLGIRFDRRGDELTAVLPFSEKLIGNPALPALHGGVTAAFLETTAVLGLLWATLDASHALPEGCGGLPRLPKTIDLCVEDMPVFKGSFGVANGNNAVKITEVIRRGPRSNALH